jgi:hypothetical protein
MTAFQVLAIALCWASVMFTLLNTRRLWRQARQRERDERTRWLAQEPRREIEQAPRPLDLFAPCPYCGTPAYHLLSAPREHSTEAASDPWGTSGAGIPLWKVATGNVWAVSRSPRTPQSDATRYRIDEKPSVTVIDRECLSCGKTWMETDPALAAPQARSIPDTPEETS